MMRGAPTALIVPYLQISHNIQTRVAVSTHLYSEMGSKNRHDKLYGDEAKLCYLQDSNLFGVIPDNCQYCRERLASPLDYLLSESWSVGLTGQTL